MNTLAFAVLETERVERWKIDGGDELNFDRKRFFDSYRAKFGALKAGQVEGLNDLLDSIEDDLEMTDLRWAAYTLATSKHETADTFMPIDEYGSNSYFEKRYGNHTEVGKRLGNDQPGDGAKYHGRGHVQLTGKRNARVMTARLREVYPSILAEFAARTGQALDLVARPEQAKDPVIAYLVMSVGMREGKFTGKKLSDYISGDKCDYRNARRIINGTDRADLIAGYAVAFEKILRAAVDDEAEHADDDEIEIQAASFAASTPEGDRDEKGESVAAQPVGTQPATAVDPSSRKSIWTTILAVIVGIPGAVWGFLEKNAELAKTFLIIAAIFGALYLIRQTVMGFIREKNKVTK